MPGEKQTNDGRTGGKYTERKESSIDRRSFLILGSVAASTGGWFAGSATADQVDDAPSAYGTGGYGMVPFGGVEESTS